VPADQTEEFIQAVAVGYKGPLPKITFESSNTNEPTDRLRKKVTVYCHVDADKTHAFAIY